MKDEVCGALCTGLWDEQLENSIFGVFGIWLSKIHGVLRSSFEWSLTRQTEKLPSNLQQFRPVFVADLGHCIPF